MLAEQRQDRSALRWIRGELDQTLRTARTALEDFVDGQQDQLRICSAELHHVHGALEMVQVYGGAMLADEMERLTVALEQGQVRRPQAASEALMLGLVQLPAYLEKVENGAADVPLLLLPLMNDLRAAREAPLVSETSLFAPKLDAVIAAETVRPGSGNRDLPRLIQEQRSHYHRGLLSWLRGQDPRQALVHIRDVLDALNSGAGTARFRRLLSAGEALAISMLDSEQEPAPAAKPLFGKLDRVFKQVIDQGEEVAMLAFPLDLLKNLLYYVARSDSTDPAVAAVKQSADLANNFPDAPLDGGAPGSLGAPDRKLFEAVGEALAQDLRDVKDQLDLYMRGDRNQVERLAGLAQPIQRIADTLGMVGRGDLRSRLRHRCDELNAVDSYGEPLPDERLMALAGDLLHVESALSSLASSSATVADAASPLAGTDSQMLSEGELQQHVRAAIDEAMLELAKTKEAILEYLDKPQSTEPLGAVPARLHMVAGVLQMLELPEAGHLLDRLKSYMAGLASGQDAPPDAEQRDAIADLVMSAELYMQSALEPGSDRGRLLAYADQALQRLALDQEPSSESAVDEEEPTQISALEFDELLTETDDDIAFGQDVESTSVDTPGESFETRESSEFALSGDPFDTAPVLDLGGSQEAETESEPKAQDEPSQIGELDEPTASVSASSAIPAPDEPAASVDSTEIAEEQPEIAQPQTDETLGLADDALDEDTIDSEILEVFSEEAEEELQSIQTEYPKWRDNPGDREAMATLRRSFHTLKGSGRIVGASNIGEFSWAIENLLNRVIDGTVDTSPLLFGILDETLSVLPALVAESSTPGGTDTDVSVLAERAFALASGQPLEPADEAEEQVAGAQTLETPVEFGLPTEVADEPSGVPAQALESEDAPPLPGPPEALISGTEPELVEPAGYSTQDLGDAALPAGELSAAAGSGEATERSLAEQVPTDVAQADAQPPVIPDESILTDAEMQDSEFSELDAAHIGSTDSSLNAIFLNEVHGHLNVLGDFVQRGHANTDQIEIEEAVQRAMHTLKGSARTADVKAIAELASALEDLCAGMRLAGMSTDPESLDVLERSHQTLSDLCGAIEDPQRKTPKWKALRDEIRDQIPAHDTGPHEAESDSVYMPELETDAGLDDVDPELLEIFLEEAKELLESLDGEMAQWERSVNDLQAVAQLQRTLHTMKGGARLSGVSSVGDLSHAMESAFESVAERRVSGSQRLFGLVRQAVDALAQDVDQLVRGRMPVEHPTIIERLEAAAHEKDWQDLSAAELDLVNEQDELALDESLDAASEMLEAQPDDADSELLGESQLLSDSELVDGPSYLIETVPTAYDVEPLAGTESDDGTIVQFPTGDEPVAGDGFVPRRPLPTGQPEQKTGHERVRVPSESLDQMVNNAGEVSIYRARLEQQNSTFAFNLGELQQTIERLRRQLRDLEGETEAQVRSRHEREQDTRADFDPLEMDRYSTMQQLSRALSETVEDLSNLGQSLSDLSRDTDTLLMQQARVTNDLQDGLLRTRMVKFSSRVPRLERVVRQTSHSLGKQARLEVVGGAEDMDRAILERMMSPLEHLLRNAVSHGIEDTDTRRSNGKPAEGVITLELAREGTDVVLTLADDGAGLDRERIRNKAIQRGLVEADTKIDDDDLYQLILEPGFSTAVALSQVSGRGVGMDIVVTEVKDLGGSLETDSQPGRGTSFTIRLPFTLAITDSLLLSLGDEIYAVPHSSMDGVVRISSDELRAIYAGEQESFHYGARDYSVRYLGNMLGTQAASLAENVRWVPLLLVRSGEHRVAIQVDSLLGNRQIVVKSVGTQLGSVRWFTGGTILADGQIALILDINSLVRMDSSHPVVTEAEPEAVNKGVSVMVVDDSITVRKVTSRLLERHNMHVVTAKDGVDAVTQLQDTRPDVVLLDIEMPRMDGYELARHMRSTPNLADIPIIMITSRTGDKHRNRALELGVKRYLGKPYQEAELLENIYTVLADSAL